MPLSAERVNTNSFQITNQQTTITIQTILIYTQPAERLNTDPSQMSTGRGLVPHPHSEHLSKLCVVISGLCCKSVLEQMVAGLCMKACTAQNTSNNIYTRMMHTQSARTLKEQRTHTNTCAQVRMCTHRKPFTRTAGPGTWGAIKITRISE